MTTNRDNPLGNKADTSQHHNNISGWNENEVMKWISRLDGGFPLYERMDSFDKETIRIILEAIYNINNNYTLHTHNQDEEESILLYQKIFARLQNTSEESKSIMWGLLFGFISELIEENHQLEKEVNILRIKMSEA